MRQQLSSRARPPTVVTSLAQTDAVLAASIRARRQKPSEIAASVLCGVEAVKTSLVHFMATPPRIGEGISKLGLRLLACIDVVITEELKGEDAYARFKTAWTNFFGNVAEMVTSIETDLRRFAQQGEPKALISALTTIFTEVSNGVLTLLPPETANELGKYFDAVGDIVAAIGDSWEEFENGQLTDGIELLYFGLRNATDPVIPPSLRNDQTYQTLVQTLDGVIGSLSETVMDYKQRIVEGSVCWRHVKSRGKKRPQVCPENFRWNGEQFCFPHETAALIASARTASTERVDTAALKKGTDSAAQGKGVPNGAIPAHCDESTNFTEKQGHWCYAPCPVGFESTGKQCRVMCQGEFHADGGPAMCGKSPMAVGQAILQMFVETISNVATLASQITEMKENGISAKPLTGTIQTLINLGKPFAYKKCPVVEL